MVSPRISLVRPRDLLVLDIEVDGLLLDPGPPPRLVRDPIAQPALLIVHFPPQAFLEEARPTGSPSILDNPFALARARAAGASRLVFRLPADRDAIPYTTEALLAWDTFELVTGQAATASRIELPFRLPFDPGDAADWIPAPLELDDPVPIWRVRQQPHAGGARTLLGPFTHRANAGESPAWIASVDERQRSEIAALTELPGSTPVSSRAMELSALGAWFDLAGDWDPPAPLRVESWRHRATMGREQSVVVVERGMLAPFGHRASFVTFTHREYLPQQDLGPDKAAMLVQEQFVIVREPSRSYAGFPIQDQRNLPFRQVEIRTYSTPPLMRVEETDLFWPQLPGLFAVGGSPVFRFDLTATDWNGQRSSFSMPLLFVGNNRTNQTEIQNRYDAGPYGANPATWPEQRGPGLIGQPVAYVAATPDGEVTLPTQRMDFALVFPLDADGRTKPALRFAEVRLRALDQLTGYGPLPRVKYNREVYLAEGPEGANLGQVVLDVIPPATGSAPALALRSDQAGGLGAPKLDIAAISRSLGPVGAANGGVTAVARQQFPGGIASYIADVLGQTKLLGVLDLKELIIDSGAATIDQIPKAVTIEKNGRLETSFSWKGALKPAAQLDLSVKLTSDPPNPGAIPAAPEIDVHGTITNLDLLLIPNVAEVMKLHFDRIEFESRSNQKQQVRVEIASDGITFLGPLSFLTEIKRFLGDSLGLPPGVDVSPQGLRISYSLALPTIGVGIFMLQNVAISAELALPFAPAGANDPMRFRFAFCSRQQPFLLTVSALGGGGFVALEITPDGLALLEISLEFGAAVALNLGIASGSVSVMAGIYFRLELAGPPEKKGVSLTGFVRVNGSLEVLGIITISVEFYLGLTWKDPKAWGIARLTVEVEIAFFSKSVSLEVERQFAGTATDPTFADLMDYGAWSTYRGAFIA